MKLLDDLFPESKITDELYHKVDIGDDYFRSDKIEFRLGYPTTIKINNQNINMYNLGEGIVVEIEFKEEGKILNDHIETSGSSYLAEYFIKKKMNNDVHSWMVHLIRLNKESFDIFDIDKNLS